MNSRQSMTDGFLAFALRNGPLLDLSDDPFPGRFSAWDSAQLQLAQDGTHFVFVMEGEAALASASGCFTLRPGMYGAIPGAATIGGAGKGIAITRRGYSGLFLVGGPIEGRGRLRYIDGCTDSLLVAPVLRGDPCLNLLHIPPGIAQTRHTHPSYRLGLIVAGRGRCVTPDCEVPLSPGLPFCIPADGPHSFHTDDESLLVIAYHPDSDCGPTHEEHPMVTRTIVDGTPASLLREIRTDAGALQ